MFEHCSIIFDDSQISLVFPFSLPNNFRTCFCKGMVRLRYCMASVYGTETYSRIIENNRAFSCFSPKASISSHPVLTLPLPNPTLTLLYPTLESRYYKWGGGHRGKNSKSESLYGQRDENFRMELIIYQSANTKSQGSLKILITF